MDRQRITINICVVWQDINRDSGIFLCCGRVIVCHWRVIDWRHIDVHRGGLRYPTGRNDVGETVCPVEIVVWRVGYAAIWVDRDRAVSWTVIGIQRHHFIVAFKRIVI